MLKGLVKVKRNPLEVKIGTENTFVKYKRTPNKFNYSQIAIIFSMSIISFLTLFSSILYFTNYQALTAYISSFIISIIISKFTKSYFQMREAEKNREQVEATD